VLVTVGNAATLAAKATTTIPIVFNVNEDPNRLGPFWVTKPPLWPSIQVSKQESTPNETGERCGNVRRTNSERSMTIAVTD
jgi:hypothetical protein